METFYLVHDGLKLNKDLQIRTAKYVFLTFGYAIKQEKCLRLHYA